MFKLFNKIRKQSISESRLGKYIIYALGEIILVVIGILIALQINISNQQKNQTKKTNTYLNTLNSEILLNINRIDFKVKNINEEIIEANNTLAHLNSTSAKDYTEEDLKSKAVTRPIYKAIMSRSTFDDLINSGTLEHLKDDGLKKKILNIEAYIDYANASFSNAKNVWTDIQLPYLMKYSAVATNWDTLSGVKIAKVDFKRDKKAFIHNRDYSNILALRMRMLNNYENTLLEIKEQFFDLSEHLELHLNNQ